MSRDLPTTPSALTFARLLGEGPLAKVALAAALEQVSFPAFIVSQSGTMLHANTRGAKVVAPSESRRRSLFKRAIATLGEPDATLAALVTPLRVEGRPTYYLIIFGETTSTEELVCQTARLWELTPRQTEVVMLVARGMSNKEIAVTLDCTERTVETHLTAVFRRSGLDGRGALLAHLVRR
ncbi:MAG: helix-turn-helix transcriptional regulator [Myxococcales bacterium]|nr:helix-turn-helix transcriptional regulator [Myxococcales bacterium]